MNIHGLKEAARLGIEVVYQDLALGDNLDVVENMYLAASSSTASASSTRRYGGQGARDAARRCP